MIIPFSSKSGFSKSSIYLDIIPISLFFSSNSKYLTRMRWKLFLVKGSTCSSCRLKATHVVFWVEQNSYDRWPDIEFSWNSGSWPGLHVDAACETEDGYTMMTIDHIVPRSKGGNDLIENLQPMCSPCNATKADKS